MNTSLSKRFLNTTNAVIVGAKRTPIGSFMGCLKDMSAPALGTTAAKGALASCNVEATDVQEVYFGAVMTGGMGQAPDRQVALGAGVQNDTPSTTINKVCASGMKSVMVATQAIQLGTRDIVMAGGMESMSRCPHFQYLRNPTVYGHG
jgi:acetyl-CoA C-acetyltransferase